MKNSWIWAAVFIILFFLSQLSSDGCSRMPDKNGYDCTDPRRSSGGLSIFHTVFESAISDD